MQTKQKRFCPIQSIVDLCDEFRLYNEYIVDWVAFFFALTLRNRFTACIFLFAAVVVAAAVD